MGSILGGLVFLNKYSVHADATGKGVSSAAPSVSALFGKRQNQADPLYFNPFTPELKKYILPTF